jgi:hypothetical protein
MGVPNGGCVELPQQWLKAIIVTAATAHVLQDTN